MATILATLQRKHEGTAASLEQIKNRLTAAGIELHWDVGGAAFQNVDLTLVNAAVYNPPIAPLNPSQLATIAAAQNGEPGPQRYPCMGDFSYWICSKSLQMYSGCPGSNSSSAGYLKRPRACSENPLAPNQLKRTGMHSEWCLSG